MAEEYVISVVLEGNASSMTNATNKASKSQQTLKKSTTEANVALLANIAVFQATSSIRSLATACATLIFSDVSVLT